MAESRDLRAKRAKVVGELRALIDHAEAEDRDFTAEERQTEERLQGDLDELTARIQRAEKREKLELSDLQVIPETEAKSEADSFRQFFLGSEGRSRTFERRDPTHLIKGDADRGGNTVNRDFVESLYETIKEFSVIRQANPTVLVTAKGDDLLIPKTANFSTASIVGEANQIGQSNPTFAQETLRAYKYAFILVASRELIEDTAVSDLIGFFAAQGGRALGDASGEHFVTGDGSGKPQGITVGATVGVTAAATDAITADELIELYHSVIRPYRVRGTWLVNDSTLLAIRKLKDGENQYLWQPGLQAGEPDRLLGRPILPDVHVPEIEADSVPAVFGDMAGYYVRDVGSVEVVRSDEYLFDTDQVAWRFINRTDGKLIDTSAVKSLKMDDGS